MLQSLLARDSPQMLLDRPNANGFWAAVASGLFPSTWGRPCQPLPPSSARPPQRLLHQASRGRLAPAESHRATNPVSLLGQIACWLPPPSRLCSIWTMRTTFPATPRPEAPGQSPVSTGWAWDKEKLPEGARRRGFSGRGRAWAIGLTVGWLSGLLEWAKGGTLGPLGAPGWVPGTAPPSAAPPGPGEPLPSLKAPGASSGA